MLLDIEVTFDTFFKGKSLPICSLCCILGGSYKLSSNNKWVHMSCCIYNPNIYFLDSINFNIPNLSKIKIESLNSICNLCESTIGSCIKCTFNKCNKWFHITCFY